MFDIYIELVDNVYCIRLCIDGVLYFLLDVLLDVGVVLIVRLKVLGNLDIVEYCLL